MNIYIQNREARSDGIDVTRARTRLRAAAAHDVTLDSRSGRATLSGATRRRLRICSPTLTSRPRAGDRFRLIFAKRRKHRRGSPGSRTSTTNCRVVRIGSRSAGGVSLLCSNGRRLCSTTVAAEIIFYDAVGYDVHAFGGDDSVHGPGHVRAAIARYDGGTQKVRLVTSYGFDNTDLMICFSYPWTDLVIINVIPIGVLFSVSGPALRALATSLKFHTPRSTRVRSWRSPRRDHAYVDDCARLYYILFVLYFVTTIVLRNVPLGIETDRADARPHCLCPFSHRIIILSSAHAVSHRQTLRTSKLSIRNYPPSMSERT